MLAFQHRQACHAKRERTLLHRNFKTHLGEVLQDRPRLVRLDALGHHVDDVVHHGGAGTTQTALTAGFPSVIVPHVVDQFTWGRVIQRLGAGPKAAPRRTLRPEVLAARIRKAAGTPSMRVRAAELGAALQAEDGCAEAVRLVEEVVAKHV